MLTQHKANMQAVPLLPTLRILSINFSLAALSASGPEQEVIVKEQVQSLLSLVSDEDQQVLTLAVVYGMSGEALAQRLGIRPNAARVRLHRSLARLRTALLQQSAKEQEDASDE